MKKIALVALLFTAYFFSCQKSAVLNIEKKDPVAELPKAAETKPQYDNTNFGVYKGVIIGSSGTIVFRINNGDNIVKAYLTIDDQKDTLTTTATLVLGQPFVNVLFTGKISSMKISADAHGNATLSNIQIQGHNHVEGILIHENSNKQVLCYEGTLEDGGVINAARMGVGGDTTFLIAKFKEKQDTIFVGMGLHSIPSRDSLWTRLYSIMLPSSSVNISGSFFSGTDSLRGTWSFHGSFKFDYFKAKRTY